METFDQEATAQARDAAIASVRSNAPERWRRRAGIAVEWCAANLVDFTADDVWAFLAEAFPDERPHHPAALGPIFQDAARAGLITKTGEERLSGLKRRHRNLTVWRGQVACTPSMP